MRSAHSRHAAPRRGAVSPLVLLVTVFIVIPVTALAIDIGYMALVRAQLQNAADAAALAGASQLLDKELLKSDPALAKTNAISNGRSQAKSFAGKNYGGGVSLVLDDNLANTATGDICVGYLQRPTDSSNALVPATLAGGRHPNSVQVIVHRDETRNNPLTLFFARAIGVDSWGLRATATATLEGDITGFRIQAPGTTTCKLLPFALHIDTWNSVVAGNGPDQFSRNPDTGAISSDSDGIHECKLYPLSNSSGGSELPPGNFGTVDIGPDNNAESDIERQIYYGPNAQDLSHFPNSTVRLDPTTGTLQLKGDTGVSAGFKDALHNIRGQPRIIPIYSTVSNPGNNADYTIVAFAGVTITEVVLTGKLAYKHLTIQPCFVIDANALGGGTESSSFFVYRPLALTR